MSWARASTCLRLMLVLGVLLPTLAVPINSQHQVLGGRGEPATLQPRFGSWAQLIADINPQAPTKHHSNDEHSALKNTDGPIFHKEICGVRAPSNFQRIIGGTEAKEGSVPWQVGMIILPKKNDKSIVPTITCGGTLITPYAVLTAAHCLVEKPERYEAVVGRHHSDINNREECRSQRLKIIRYYKHPNFKPATLSNDIGVAAVRTSYGQGVQFSMWVVPACMGYDTEYSVGEIGTVSGWGLLEENARLVTTKLNKVEVPIISKNNCFNSYNQVVQIEDEKQFCAGVTQGGKDACSGDSGGPFTLDIKRMNGSSRLQRTYIAGVVSYGIGCGRGSYPGVYSKVTGFLPWIVEHALLSQDEKSKGFEDLSSKNPPITTIPRTTTTTTTTTTPTTTTKAPAPKNVKTVGPVCKGTYRWLRCRAGEQIKVESAFLGRADKHVCPSARARAASVRAAASGPEHKSCAYENAAEDIQKFCRGKGFCYVNTNHTKRRGPFQPNDCLEDDVKPYVTVEYTCEKKPKRG